MFLPAAAGIQALEWHDAVISLKPGFPLSRE
jgi:hypothetical protein